MAEIIEMPKLSDTMTTGTVVSWLKKVGDEVASGDMIAEIETDKATMELEVFTNGILLKQFVEQGASIEVGKAIAAIGEKGENVSAPDDSSGSSSSEKKDDKEETSESKDEKKDDSKKEEGPEQEPVPVEGDRLKVSPLAKKIAADKGISLDSIKGSGPGGRILKEDVLKAAESDEVPASSSDKKSSAPSSAPAKDYNAAREDEKIPVSTMRGVIAKRLLESKTQIPHFYLDMEVDAAPLADLRASLNQALAELPPEKGGVKFSVNDLILKATAEALRRVPAANASWGDKEIVQHGAVHLAFAVAVDEGLVTPVIRHADQKSLREVAAEAKELIKKAKSKKLKPDEMTGSTFTVTNLGMYGINSFYGIINPPNAAILSVGATVKKPVVDKNDQIVIGRRMMLGLSGDHRVVDGAVGAELLVALREVIETPALMLV